MKKAILPTVVLSSLFAAEAMDKAKPEEQVCVRSSCTIVDHKPNKGLDVSEKVEESDSGSEEMALGSRDYSIFSAGTDDMSLPIK